MTSEKQIQANRLNAQKSTGPRTDHGKEQSSMNGFKSHITGLTVVMTSEDKLEQERFVSEITADLKPVGAYELNLARTIAIDHWRINRAKTNEENMFAIGQHANPFTHPVDEIQNAMGNAATFTRHAKAFNTLSLYEARLTKIIHANMDRLKQIQAERRKAEAEAENAKAKPEPIHQTQHNQAFTAKNGFAPHTAAAAPETTAEIPIAA